MYIYKTRTCYPNVIHEGSCIVLTLFQEQFCILSYKYKMQKKKTRFICCMEIIYGHTNCPKVEKGGVPSNRHNRHARHCPILSDISDNGRFCGVFQSTYNKGNHLVSVLGLLILTSSIPGPSVFTINRFGKRNARINKLVSIFKEVPV